MNDFKEFTFGWITLAFVIPTQAFITYLYINNIGDRPIPTNAYLIITLVFIIIYLLFYGLTTTVTADSITVSFGIGLIRKRIALKRIQAIETVTSPWYYGWGVRVIPNGMLYSISGSAAIKLKFHDTASIIRIGTKDSSVLKKEIEKRLDK